MMSVRETIVKYSGGVIVPLVVLVAGAAAFFILLPKYRAVKAAREIVTNKQSEVSSRQNILRNLQNLLAEYDVKKETLKPLDESVPAAPKIPELLGNLDQLAKQSGVLISSLNISPAQSLATINTGQSVGQVKKTEAILTHTDGLGIMQIDIQLVGRYPNLSAWLKNLEQNLRLLDAQIVVASEADEQTGDQTYNLKIYTYYQKERE